MVPAARWASSTMLARQAVDAREVVSVRERLGQQRSAPTGVLSSWLMLATKSVRIDSRRTRSVTSSTVDQRAAVGERAPRARQHPQRRTNSARRGPYRSRSPRRRRPCSRVGDVRRRGRRRAPPTTAAPRGCAARLAPASTARRRRPAGRRAPPGGARPRAAAPLGRRPRDARRSARAVRPTGRRLREKRRTCAVELAPATAPAAASVDGRRASTCRAAPAPVCSGSQPVTMYRTRSPMFTAWSPMRS